MKKNFMVISTILSSIILPSVVVAEDLNINDIDNREYDKMNIQGQKYYKISNSTTIMNKNEKNIVVPKKEEPKIEAKVEVKKEEPKIEAKVEVKKEEPKIEAKVEVKKEEPKWFDERITLQSEETNLHEILYEILPINIKKEIDLINKDSMEIKIYNSNFINRPISEILDQIAIKNNIFIDYDVAKISVSTIKSKTFVLPSNSSIKTESKVSLGTGGNSGSSGSSGASSGSSGGSSGAIASSINSTVDVSSKDSSEIIKSLESIMTTLPNKIQEKVLYDQNTGIINVTASRRTMNTVEKYLNEIISSNDEQILIETKILRFKSYDKLAYGVQWSNIMGSLSNGMSITGAVNMMKSAASGVNNSILQSSASGNASTLTLGVSSNNVEKAFISALEQLGNVETLSEPTILLSNNNTSTINSGKVINYISKTTVTPPITAGTPPSISVEPAKIQDGFSMVINGKISADKEYISLFLSPILNNTLSLEPFKDADGNILANLPVIDSRSLSLFTKIKNGDTIVLGGLKESMKDKSDNNVPILSQIPILKNLMGYKENTESKDELIILVKATRITN